LKKSKPTQQNTGTKNNGRNMTTWAKDESIMERKTFTGENNPFGVFFLVIKNATVHE
jgi:hypothetical protein